MSYRITSKVKAKTKNIVLAAVLTSSLAISVVYPGIMADAKPGTANDPLVTRSYVDEYISSQLDRTINNQLSTLQAQIETLDTSLGELEGKLNPFKDTEGHWALPSIRYLKGKGIISGFEDGTFQPNGKVTRAQLAAMIVRAKGLKIPSNPKLEFKDVPNGYWAYQEIAAAKQAGIISGYPDGSFAPSQPVTREQIAGMVSKAFVAELIRPDQKFTDIQDSWAKESITNLSRAGIIGGYPDQTFAPKQSASRAEVSVILSRALDPAKRLTK